ncbi:MAG: helicase C-terminal domain-containing protein [Leptospiraceae bacterium]|nr:helicase C-terminal domain-containing protein [Leptospiraceae bacterium]
MQSLSKIESFFQKEKMKSVFPEYEPREEQLSMAKEIAKSLSSNEFLIVEAGTGVGKSLSYLIPAVLHARETGKKVVISTETIALQSQLIQKDIPIVSRILGEPVRAEIALGSSNYVCKRKLNNVINEGSFGLEMMDKLKEFYEWEKRTSTGIKSEYKGFASGEFWSKITREPDNCLGRRCPNFSFSYYFLEKEKWKNAEILIVNHHLLAANIAGEYKLLPEFQNLIIDEAHNFPEILGRSFSKSTSYEDINQLITSIIGNTKKSGVIEKIQSPSLRTKLDKSVRKAETLNFDYFQKLLSELPIIFQEKRIESKLKIDGGDLENELFNIVSILEEYKVTFNKDTDDEIEKENQLEIEMLYSRISAQEEIIKNFRSSDLKKFVKWVSPKEEDSKLPFNKIHIQPLHSDEILVENLFPKMESIIFTSATLASEKNSFGFFLREIGNPSTNELVLKSPFDYKNNSIIYLPKNLKDPTSDNDGYHEDLCKLIPILVELTKGNSFVLFTSNKSLKTVYEGIKAEVPYEIFSQVELGAEKAKEKFLETNNSILFGVSTFWQGIDIKGERLQSVIITRIPFQPPNEPVLEAKIEEIKNNKGNPFGEIQLPRAILTMKQGFGRLIRSKSDQGIVSILDPRIQSKSYGKQILSSLPNSKIVYSFQELKSSFEKMKAPKY